MATTVERDTPMMGKDTTSPVKVPLPMAANTKVLKGTIGCANASGQATPGAVATTLTCVGRVEETVDNTGGAAGALFAEIRQGTFKWKIGAAGDVIAQADFGKTVFIIDNETVGLTNGGSTRSAAGKVVKVDTDGVWVKTVL